MKALLFGSRPDPDEPRPVPTDELEERLAALPFGLHHLEDARPIHPDWVVTRPIISGVCGSDTKLVLGEFEDGDIDNPMAAFSSLPHVPGHEVVAEVVSLGPEARGVEVGQRVVLNPWLSCAPRGIEPLCPPCQAGDLNMCWSFTKGDISPGVHVGRGHRGTRRLGRAAWPPTTPCSSRCPTTSPTRPPCWPTPSRSRSTPSSAIRRRPGAGCWSSGPAPWAWPAWPSSTASTRRGGGGGGPVPGPGAMARQFGASLVFAHEPRLALVEALADWSGGVLHQAFDGLPMAHPGHVDVVYDSVAKPETFEVGVRVLAERGRLVYTGVAVPGRWEWTPVYFKELTIVGSNAFAMEEFEGVRRHALDHYLHFVQDGRIDLDRHGHPPLPARELVGRLEDVGPPRGERRAQGHLRPQRGQGLTVDVAQAGKASAETLLSTETGSES